MYTLIKEIKILLLLSLPLIVMLLAQKILQVISTSMMGRLGAAALAAGALASAAYLIFLIIGIGILNAVGVLIAQCVGAQNNKEVNALLYHGFYVSLFLSLVSMGVIWIFPAIYTFLGEEPLLVAMTSTLIHAMMWGFPALLGFATLREFVSALNYQRVVMIISFGAIPFNCFLFYLFIQGMWGLPSLSVAWIGYINAATEWVMFLSLLFYVSKHSHLRDYSQFLKPSRIQIKTIIKILYLGIPNGITAVLEVMMSTIFVVMMGYFGVISLAAHQIAFQCTTFVYMFPLGISLALGLRIGNSIGAKRAVSSLKMSIYAALSIEAIIATLVIFVFVFKTNQLIQFFISTDPQNTAEIKYLATCFLIIAAFFHFFDALQSIFTGVLRGCNDTFICMMIALVSFLLIALCGGYFMAFTLHLEGIGLWLGLALGLVTSSVLLFLRIQKHLSAKQSFADELRFKTESAIVEQK